MTTSRPLPTTGVTYYTVSDHGFFLGTVALLNSLRLTGNEGELVVLDAGLTSSERELLSGHAAVIAPPVQIEGNPAIMKPYPHFLNPSGTIVLIDSDIIVTGSLGEVVDRAREGKICVYPAWWPEARSRWFAEWESTLELRSPLRREAWVHAGVVAFSTEHWPDLLGRWWEVCERVPQVEHFAPQTAFNAGDADALNALLMSEIPRDALAVLPEGDEVFGGDASIDDVDTLACSSAGHRAKILHFVDSPKPWQRSGWFRLAATDYVRLMRRLLLATDVPLRLDRGQVPLWFRPGAGEVALRLLGGANQTVVWVSHRAPESVQERLRVIRRRRG